MKKKMWENDPAVTAFMDVIMQWPLKMGFNEGYGLHYERPSPSQVKEMAKELLDAAGIYYER